MKKPFLVAILCLAVTLEGAQASSLAKPTPDFKPSISNDEIQKLFNQIDKTDHEVGFLKDSVSEIRRDEINYKIEKDLLKEAYSSSLQTVNWATAFVLGVLTIISGLFGVIGFRNLSRLRRAYTDQLDELIKNKRDFDMKSETLFAESEKLKKNLEDILFSNKKTEDRIRLLEFQEKASELIKTNNYQRAIEYINIGLDINKDDDSLLRNKAYCLLKLKRFAESYSVYKHLISIQEDETQKANIVINIYAELLLILKNVEEFEKIRKEYSAFIEQASGGALAIYLDSIRALVLQDLPLLKSIVRKFLTTERLSVRQKWLGEWTFDEIHFLLNSIQDSKVKNLFLSSLPFWSGSTSGNDLLKDLEKY